MIELQASLTALGWTCVHLAWQALLLALVLRLYSTTAASADARGRYAAAVLTLVVLAGMTAATAWLHWPRPIALEVVGTAATQPAPADSVATSLLAIALPVMGAAWLLVTVCLALRLAFALRAVRRTRDGSCAVDPALDAICAKLALQAARGCPVVLRYSDDVTAPCVIGAMNATILLPRTLAASLTLAELRALFAHELAHVRRRDYSVNLALRVLSLPLEWHPAVRWILRRIEHERELCCDDEAAALCSDRTDYARALARLALVAPGYNMAPGAATTSLTERIRRIGCGEAGSPPPRRGAPALAATAAALLLATTAFAVPRTVNTADQTYRNRIASQLVRFNAIDPAGTFTLDVLAGRAYQASMNGLPLPPARLRQNGAHITLVGEQPAETVKLVLSAPDSIRWTARTPTTH